MLIFSNFLWEAAAGSHAISSYYTVLLPASLSREAVQGSCADCGPVAVLGQAIGCRLRCTLVLEDLPRRQRRPYFSAPSA